MEIKFYEKVDDELLKFAVIISKTDDKWVFCKHKERKDEYKNKTISVVNRYRSCMETYDRCL